MSVYIRMYKYIFMFIFVRMCTCVLLVCIIEALWFVLFSLVKTDILNII